MPTNAADTINAAAAARLNRYRMWAVSFARVSE
jgi:hypothetical protein